MSGLRNAGARPRGRSDGSVASARALQAQGRGWARG